MHVIHRNQSKTFQSARWLLCAAALCTLQAPAWAAPPDKSSLGRLNCAEEQIAKFDGIEWVCADAVRTGPQTVFVTSRAYTGNLMQEGLALNGIEGANALCQAAAALSSSVRGNYRAWIAADPGDIDMDIGEKLPQNNSGYFLPDPAGPDFPGPKIADSRFDLFNADVNGDYLLNPINRDEFGWPIGDVAVWTGAGPIGNKAGDDCNDWTSSDPGVGGRQGSTNAVDDTWTFGPADMACNQSAHLICFQD